MEGGIDPGASRRSCVDCGGGIPSGYVRCQICIKKALKAPPRERYGSSQVGKGKE